MLKHLGGALLAAAIACAAPAAARGGTHHHRLRHGADRRPGTKRQGRTAGNAGLGRGDQRQGGLLGRPVKLVYYDDQSNPASVPGLYTKLLDVDKVDLVISGYATNMVVPALP